jgi:hypothetical protein
MSLVMIAISWWPVAPIALQNSLQLTQLVVIGRQLAESKRKLPFHFLPIGQEDSPPQNSPNSAEILMQRGNGFAQKSQRGHQRGTTFERNNYFLLIAKSTGQRQPGSKSGN